jgi:hypothetical protein
MVRSCQNTGRNEKLHCCVCCTCSCCFYKYEIGHKHVFGVFQKIIILWIYIFIMIGTILPELICFPKELKQVDTWCRMCIYSHKVYDLSRSSVIHIFKKLQKWIHYKLHVWKLIGLKTVLTLVEQPFWWEDANWAVTFSYPACWLLPFFSIICNFFYSACLSS